MRIMIPFMGGRLEKFRGESIGDICNRGGGGEEGGGEGGEHKEVYEFATRSRPEEILRVYEIRYPRFQPVFVVDLNIAVVMNKGVVCKNAHVTFRLFYKICVEANVTDCKTYIIGYIRVKEDHDLKKRVGDGRIDDS
tara:strand:- start:3473 stop:3883 length:411 start_codon:yes stop_codon:yes gene_type:complete